MPYNLSDYLNAFDNNDEDIPLHLLTPEIYEQWTINEQVDFDLALCDYIKLNMAGLEIIPDFLQNDRDVLLAMAYDVWNRSDQEIDNIKTLIRQSGYADNWDFIKELIACDDGSLAAVVAGESIENLPEYWLELCVAFYESPREYFWEPWNAEMRCAGVPEALMNDQGFVLTLMEAAPGYYPAIGAPLKDHPEVQKLAERYYVNMLQNSPGIYSKILPEDMKSNYAVCVAVLKCDGLKLAEMPDECKANAELAYVAIMQNPQAIECIHDDLTYDVEFIKKTIADCPQALEYSIPRVKYLYQNG